MRTKLNKPFALSAMLGLVLPVLAWTGDPVIGSPADNEESNPGPVHWTMVGPGAGGQFNMLQETPDHVLLLGGDVSGLYRSRDKGGHWLPIGVTNSSATRGFSTVFDRTNVCSFAWCPARAAPRDTDVTLVGIEGKVMRSVDGGRTFPTASFDSVAGAGLANEWPAAMAACAWHPDTVYLAMHWGTGGTAYSDTVQPHIELSTNRGLTWKHQAGYRQMPALASPACRIIKLLVHPTKGAVLFAVTGADRFTSSSIGGADLRNRPSQCRLFRSQNAGLTWKDVTPEGSASTGLLDAVIHPLEPDSMFATTFRGRVTRSHGGYLGNVWLSTNQGDTWTALAQHTGCLAYSIRHAVRDPVFYVADMQRNYVPDSAASSGMFKSVTPYTSWKQIDDSRDWDTGWNYTVDAAYASSGRGMANALNESWQDSISWYHSGTEYVFRGDTTGHFTNLFTDFQRPGKGAGTHYWTGRAVGNTVPMAISTAPGIVAVGWFDLGIGISRDAGRSWQMSNDSVRTSAWRGHGGDCSAILVDPDLPSTVWAAQGAGKTNTSIIRSTSDGAPLSWAATTGITRGLTTSLALDASSPVGARKLWVTSNGDLWKSTDDGKTWWRIWDRPSAGATAGALDSGLRVVAVRGSVVLAGGPGGLYRATDGGADSTSFTKVFGPGRSPGGGRGGPYAPCWGFSGAGSSYDLRYRGVHDIEWGTLPGEVFCTIAGGASGMPNYLLYRNTVDTRGGADSAGVWRSTDSGATWSLVRGLGYADHFHVMLDGSWWVSSRSCGAGGGQSNGEGIFRSRDRGRTWQQMTSNISWPQGAAMASDPVEARWIMINMLGPGVFRADLPDPARTLQRSSVKPH
jgi:hypothetical protein